MKNIKLIHFSIGFFNSLHFIPKLEVEGRKCENYPYKTQNIIITMYIKIILITIYIFMNVKSKFLFS